MKKIPHRQSSIENVQKSANSFRRIVKAADPDSWPESKLINVRMQGRVRRFLHRRTIRAIREKVRRRGWPVLEKSRREHAVARWAKVYRATRHGLYFFRRRRCTDARNQRYARARMTRIRTQTRALRVCRLRVARKSAYSSIPAGAR